MKGFTKYVSKIDFLGKPYSPTFKGKSKSKTLLGGLLSFVFCCLVSSGGFILGRELYQREQPSSNIAQRRFEINEIPLSKLQLMYSFTNLNGMQIHRDPEFMKSIEIKGEIMQILPDEAQGYKIVYYRFPLGPCSKDSYSPQIYNSIIQNGIIPELVNCLDLTKITDESGNPAPDIPIRNPINTIGNSILTLTIQKCDNVKSPGCDAYLKENPSIVFYPVFRSDYSDVTDYDNPAKFGLEIPSTSISVGQTSYMDLTYSITELQTDAGYIFVSTETETFYTVDRMMREATGYSETNRVLFNLEVDVSRIRNIVTRKYLKVQELLANLGGFVKAMSVILSFMVSKYSECALFNAIRREERVIESQEGSKSLINLNNLVDTNNSKSVMKLVKRNKKALTPIGFCKYLRLSLFKAQSSFGSLEETFSCFDALNVLQIRQKIIEIEENLKALKSTKKVNMK